MLGEEIVGGSRKWALCLVLEQFCNKTALMHATTGQACWLKMMNLPSAQKEKCRHTDNASARDGRKCCLASEYRARTTRRSPGQNARDAGSG